MQRQLSWKKDCSGSKILITTMERKLATTTISGNLFRNKHIWLHLWNKLCSETVHLIAASTVFRNKNVICSYGKKLFRNIWFDLIVTITVLEKVFVQKQQKIDGKYGQSFVQDQSIWLGEQSFRNAFVHKQNIWL